MLTTPEIFYLSSLFVSQGVTKIRLTGGEPTVRRDIVPLMQSIGSLRPQGLRELALTTNGISLHRKLDAMVEAGGCTRWGGWGRRPAVSLVCDAVGWRRMAWWGVGGEEIHTCV